jgi:hypothetical protein
VQDLSALAPINAPAFWTHLLQGPEDKKAAIVRSLMVDDDAVRPRGDAAYNSISRRIKVPYHPDSLQVRAKTGRKRL